MQDIKLRKVVVAILPSEVLITLNKYERNESFDLISFFDELLSFLLKIHSAGKKSSEFTEKSQNSETLRKIYISCDKAFAQFLVKTIHNV